MSHNLNKISLVYSANMEYPDVISCRLQTSISWRVHTRNLSKGFAFVSPHSSCIPTDNMRLRPSNQAASDTPSFHPFIPSHNVHARTGLRICTLCPADLTQVSYITEPIPIPRVTGHWCSCYIVLSSKKLRPRSKTHSALPPTEK